MSNFKKLIADDIDLSSWFSGCVTGDCPHEKQDECFQSIHEHAATRYASLLEKALDALEKTATPKFLIHALHPKCFCNECHQKETIAEITAELTNKENE